MKKLVLSIVPIIIFSCGKEKTVQLPEIQNAEITEVTDVSPVYMFYDVETDSIEFNRKNMISTTNWLVNIDKRLTLKQVLPHLQYLQEKRHGNSMHKNDNARNYFTCNDTLRNNLGFIDFTDVDFTQTENGTIDFSIDIQVLTTFIRFEDLETIKIQSNDLEDIITGLNELKSVFKKYSLNSSHQRTIVLAFNHKLSFQDYITFKSLISSLNNEFISISNSEFIY